MSVTVNKQLSLAKELFLSIALVAQEISSDTIKMMKEDHSDSIIRNSVIKSLRKVDFPEPEAPSMTINSPSLMRTETPSSALKRLSAFP